MNKQPKQQKPPLSTSGQQPYKGNRNQPKKVYTYVRKVEQPKDYTPSQDEQNRKAEEVFMKQRELEILQKMEEELKKKQEEENTKREEERMKRYELEEQQRQLKIYMEEVIIQSVIKRGEQQQQQIKYLKSSQGLSYLLETNFSDFKDQISDDLPQEILTFTERVYVIQDRFEYSRKRSNFHPQQVDSSINRPKDYHQTQRHHNVIPKNHALSRHDNRQQDQTKSCKSNRFLEQEDQEGAQWRHTRTPCFNQSKDELKYLLNVLTFENFENLKEQFYSEIKNDDSKSIHSLINKVCKESKYTQLYSKLVLYIHETQTLDTTIKIENPIDSFRSKMLLTLSDLFYDQNKLKLLLKGNSSSSSDSSTDEMQYNKRFQTFLRFLGELFTNKFLPKKIISYCVQIMMQQFVKDGLNQEDRNVEGIIVLMDSIGAEFENAWKSTSKQSRLDQEFLNSMRSSFSESQNLNLELFEKEFISFRGIMNFLTSLSASNRVSIRLRSLITNLTQRWTNNWEKVLHQKETPKTLKELHAEHQQEAQQRHDECQDNYQGTNNSQQQREWNRYLEENKNMREVQRQGQTQLKEIDLEREVNKVFKELDNQQTDSIELLKELELLKQSSQKELIKQVLTSFFNSRYEYIQNRCSLVSDLLTNTPMNITKVVLNTVLNSLFSQACDFPNIYDSFALIICPLLETNLFNLEDIKQDACNDPDDEEDKSYFFQEIKSACLLLQKED